MEKSRVFGGKCYESLASYDRGSSSWKMSQLSFFEEDQKSLDRLPKSGIAQNGQLFPLEIKELRISEKDGLQLPTPTTDQRPQRYKQEGRSTMCATLEMGAMLPTPVCNDAKNTPSGKGQWRRQGSLNVEAAKISGHTIETIGKEARLNPRFVEWMMGFPTGWTDLDL